jgi:hypothetical protein
MCMYYIVYETTRNCVATRETTMVASGLLRISCYYPTI